MLRYRNLPRDPDMEPLKGYLNREMRLLRGVFFA